MPHMHRYRFPEVTMLSLPDVEGYYDAVLVWSCLGCQQPRRHTTGLLHQTSRGLTIAAWEAQGAKDRAAGGPLAHQTAREAWRRVR